MTVLGVGSTWYSVFGVPGTGRTTCTGKYQVVGLPLNLRDVNRGSSTIHSIFFRSLMYYELLEVVIIKQ
jgi:hypothetical protein